MQKSIQQQFNTDATVFLQALIDELTARDQMTHLARQIKKHSHNQGDDGGDGSSGSGGDSDGGDDHQQSDRDLCIAYRTIEIAERKHYKAYRQLIRHFDL